MIQIFFIVTSFLCFMLVIGGLLSLIYKKDIAIEVRTKHYFGPDIEREIPVKKQKLQLHIMKNYSDRLKLVVDKKMASSKKRELERRLREAGYPLNMSAIDFRFLQLLIGGVLFLSVFLLLGSTAIFSRILLAGVVAALGIYYPSFYLSTIIKKRRHQIQKSMSDFFDMVNLSIGAGMGLDASIQKVCKQMKGPLSEEFMQTMEGMKLGKSRREAFADLRARVPIPQFQSIITSLIQADMLGVGMAKVLHQLTQRIREQRTQFAREQAMKAPVKMIFPMMLFIFPSIFIVLMGPLIIYLIENVM
ncbi:type II secretion system F family protein [Fredinandcohnia onubensis]|uniref:type II secretion system F family protein n=1 Tax=Fredinandcohnia onubensis TaxID=1571209 RepID=UPI000C0BBF25|nr:type II secretion system F family protein [Fredinandcohnia onubensis]